MLSETEISNMLFWVHAAVAYLFYRLILRLYLDRHPNDAAVVSLVGGAFLPDLIDKPLSFVFSGFPGRSVAHSVFTLAIVVVVVSYVMRRIEQLAVGTAFVVGYVSHLGADLVNYFFLPSETLLFLFWPVVADYDHVDSAYDLLSLLSPTRYILAQTILTLLAFGLWIYDGKPGSLSV